MLDLKVNKNELAVNISGTLDTILTELVYAIDVMHKKISDADARQGDAFKEVLMMTLMHRFIYDETLDAEEEYEEDREEEEAEEEHDDLEGIINGLNALREVRRYLKSEGKHIKD